jgi:hypothetical protein
MKGRGALSALHRGKQSRVERDLAVGATEVDPLDAAACKLHHGSLGGPNVFASHAPHAPTPRSTAARRQEASKKPGELGAALG